MDIKSIETHTAVYLSFRLDGCPHVLTVERARELAAELQRAADAAERRAGTLEAERKAA
jgi:hypothetical protein